MRERYIIMRRTGQYDLSWFYKYYIEEFPNIPNSTNRQMVSEPQFYQAFNMSFSFMSQAILDFLDKKFEVTKIEDEQGKITYIN